MSIRIPEYAEHRLLSEWKASLPRDARWMTDELLLRMARSALAEIRSWDTDANWGRLNSRGEVTHG